MARPRKASDDEILAATHRVINRVGPADVTLAAIAEEAGLTAGALVQRFGSKRQLLLALMERFSGSAEHLFRSLEKPGRSPLEVIFAWGDCMAEMGDSPAALAHHLAYLQLDLTDPDFQVLAKRQAVGTRREIGRLVREAVDRGELRSDLHAGDVVRLVELTVNGSLITWAFYQDGDVRGWIRKDLERMLEPYREPVP